MPTPSLLSGALLSVLALAAALPGDARAAESPMTLSMVRGGALGADAVASGALVYLPTGRLLATWDYANAAAPLRIAATAPSEGVINGLTRNGSHLYASWRGYDGSSGITTYSLANPRQPVLVSETTYPASGEKSPAGVAFANGHLYAFDNDHGIFVSNSPTRRARCSRRRRSPVRWCRTPRSSRAATASSRPVAPSPARP